MLTELTIAHDLHQNLLCSLLKTKDVGVLAMQAFMSLKGCFNL